MPRHRRTRDKLDRHVLPLLAAALALVICTGAALPASAAIEGFIGWTLPVGDLDDVSDAGVHGGASLTTPLIPGVLEGGPLLVYHDLDGVTPGDDVTITELLAQLRLTLPAGPTLQLAVGIASPSVSVAGRDLEWDDQLDVVIGAGTRIILLDLQAQWHHLEDADALSVSAGLRF